MGMKPDILVTIITDSPDIEDYDELVAYIRQRIERKSPGIMSAELTEADLERAKKALEKK